VAAPSPVGLRPVAQVGRFPDRPEKHVPLATSLARHDHRPPTTTGRRQLLVALVVGALLVGLVPLTTAERAAAEVDPCGPTGNPVACENAKPGNPPSEWELIAAGDDSIAGFPTEMSVVPGETVEFKISTDAPTYEIDLYRFGWYEGDGARHLDSVDPVLPPPAQPECLTEPDTGLVDCGNWSVSATWTVPPDAVSGVYAARLERPDTGGDNHILFIVRDDERPSDLVFQTSDTTWQAYNNWGGNSLYTGAPIGRAFKVSYNRPIRTRAGTPDGRDSFFGSEYPMLRWLERNGYDVSYITGIDTDRLGPEALLDHQVFLSVGHDEYWSGAQRDHVEAARDAGVHLAFFSGNEVYWKTRWESSIDGTGTPHRTLVSYKETRNHAKIDPSPEWTGTWRDPRFSPPSDGGRPENELTGTIFGVNCCTYEMRVPAEFGAMRLWRNTSIASLAPGTEAVLPHGTLGYEWDVDLDNGFRPPGLIRMSSTTVDVPELLVDWGSTVAPATATHQLVLHRAQSGALVFGAGTVQWSWGLDARHDGPSLPADPRMQQATVNLFADMGVQPATLQTDLVPTTASTDTQAPTTTITSPAPGTPLGNGQAVTVSGAAADPGGGVVGGVEVSLDGGQRWHPAEGTGTWTFTGQVRGQGAVDILARATDDSANLGQAAGVAVTVACPCTIFGEQDVPDVEALSDTGPVELGVRFRPDVDGYIGGVRFWRGPGNEGPHVGTLWSSDGVELASATFPPAEDTGWQEVQFGEPVAVTAGATYVASYHAPQGRYATTLDAFHPSTRTSTPPVQAVERTAAGSNGVFQYGPRQFPTASFGAPNYWVDVVFDTTSPPDVMPPFVTARTPLAGSSSVPATTTVTATFSEPIDPGTVTWSLADPEDTPVAATAGYDPDTRTATLSPTVPLEPATTYTATIADAQDLAGNPQATPDSWTFTTAAGPRPPGQCPCSLWDDTASPAVVTVADPAGVELGVRFRADTDGTVTGVRFYKGPDNAGPHAGSLWTDQGDLLARATFTQTTTQGWQEVTFDEPVDVDAGVTYVASYHAPQGHYSADPWFFLSNDVDNPPLFAPRAGTDTANGLYSYSTDPTFPTASVAANYWVDVVFQPAPAPSCPCSLFPADAVPEIETVDIDDPIEAGMRFVAAEPGVVTGVRFYKGPANPGPHTGSLWGPLGRRLAVVTFAQDGSTGWQEATFSQPVRIGAGLPYTVSYHAPEGGVSATFGWFIQPTTNGPLTAPANNVLAANGVYHLGSSARPTLGAWAANFWVDVVFVPDP
jgi:hypothetical protein